jgi:hypothetical protein
MLLTDIYILFSLVSSMGYYVKRYSYPLTLKKICATRSYFWYSCYAFQLRLSLLYCGEFCSESLTYFRYVYSSVKCYISLQKVYRWTVFPCFFLIEAALFLFHTDIFHNLKPYLIRVCNGYSDENHDNTAIQ